MLICDSNWGVLKSYIELNLCFFEEKKSCKKFWDRCYYLGYFVKIESFNFLESRKI